MLFTFSFCSAITEKKMMECAFSHAGFEGSQGLAPVSCGEEDLRRSWGGEGRAGTATVGVKTVTRGTRDWELETRLSVLGSNGEGRVWDGEESEKDEVREERR